MMISQAVLTAYHCAMMYGTLNGVPGAVAFAQKQISWVFDLFCMNSPFCLAITRYACVELENKPDVTLVKM